MQGDLCPGGRSLSRGGLCQGNSLPPVNRMTHRHKNITLPQTSFEGGKKCKNEKKSSSAKYFHPTQNLYTVRLVSTIHY